MKRLVAIASAIGAALLVSLPLDAFSSAVAGALGAVAGYVTYRAVRAWTAGRF